MKVFLSLSFSISLSLSLIISFVLNFGSDGAPQCLLDATPEASRKPITVGKVSLPIGLWDSQWDSAQLVTRMVQVVISEVLGFQAVLSGSAPSGSVVPLALSGCAKDSTGKVVCPPGPIPDNHPHHVAMEYWESGEFVRDGVRDANPERVPQVLGRLGYVGREGVYLPSAVHHRALEKTGWGLEYYRSWDALWTDPGQFFAKVADIDTSRLRPCSETEFEDLLEISFVARFTPDPHGFDASGRAKCVDKWWLSPACRSNVSRCVPLITTGDGYYVRAMMQKAIGYNMPWAIAVAPWGDYLTLPYEHDLLVYSWEPAAHFLRQSPEQVICPAADMMAQASGDMRTEGSSTPISTVIAQSVRVAAPRVHIFLSSVRLSEVDIKFLLTLFTSIGDHYAAACSWLKNTSTWREWVPDDRHCTSGQGLVDAEGGFVQNSSLGVSCSYCPAGYFSAFLDGTKMRVCQQCPAGTFQQLWGKDACQPCDMGFAQSALGQAACDRCGRGSFTNESGRTGCLPCPHGKTTEGTGYMRSEDCLCPPGSFFDVASETCPSCGDGAMCSGFGAEPEAAKGYHLIEVVNGALRIFLCDSHKFCPGGRVGTCAEGRTGHGCSRCLDNMSPRKDGTCGACGGFEGLVMFALISACCCALAVLYFFSMRARGMLNTSTGMLVAGVGQTLLVLQFLGAFSRISVDWPEPLATLLRTAAFISFDFEKAVTIGCITPVDDVAKYVVKLLLLPIWCCVLLTMHTIVWMCRRQTSYCQHMRSLAGTVGTVVSVMYTSISILALAPFQCRRQPSGEWTMLQSTAAICWTAGSHRTLLVFGCAGLTVPISFMAAVVCVVWMMPVRVSNGDVDFLNRFSFLLARVRVEARWFIPVLLTRNLFVALVPCISFAFWQSFLLGGLFSLSLGLVSWLRPWRAASTNWIDTLIMLCMLAIVFVSVSFLDDAHAGGLVELCIGAVVVSIVVPSCLAVLGFLRRLKSKKNFKFFLCHQKSGAGASARLLKMEVLDRAATARVFLDSDDLSNLTYLFQTVREDVENLIVLCSREVLQSAWCLGEITTAFMAKVPTKPLVFCDFTLPTDVFISQLTAMPVLTENSLSVADVQLALRHFITLQRDCLPEDFNEQVLLTFTNKILSTGGGEKSVNLFSIGKLATMVTPCPTSVGRAVAALGTSATVELESIIVVDTSCTEAVAAAIIFKKMLTPRCVAHGRGPPCILWPCDMCPSSCSKSILFCTPGCFQNAVYLVTLMKLVLNGKKHITPVVSSDSFTFPTPSFYAALEDSARRLCLDAGTNVEPQLLHRFAKAVFRKICSRLSVLGSIRILQVEVDTIWDRMKDVKVDDFVEESAAEHRLIFEAIVTKFTAPATAAATAPATAAAATAPASATAAALATVPGGQPRNDVTAAAAASSATAPAETEFAVSGPGCHLQEDFIFATAVLELSC